MRAGAAAFFVVAIAVGVAGCSGELSAGQSPRTPQSSQVGPSAWPSTRDPFQSPSPVATTAQLVKSVPVRLQIGVIGVDSDLMRLGLQKNGTMEVPPGGFPAGWYTGGPTPGELGPAVIAGHIDLNGPGVFLNLHKLKPGDKVTVTREDRSRPVFRVTRVARFPKGQFPTSLVYGNIDHAGLRLITCGGSFDSGTGHYADNVVAFAELIPPAL